MGIADDGPSLVNPARRAALLALLAVGTLALALIVLIRNRSPDDELLAVIAVLGGLAMLIASLDRAP